jgi:hypothetical protein
MGFIIEGFLGLALICLALWLAVYRFARAQEQRRLAAEARDAEREQLLGEAGAALRCVGCGQSLAGPMPDEGCPHCHTAALVVPESHLPAPIGEKTTRKIEVR